MLHAFIIFSNRGESIDNKTIGDCFCSVRYHRWNNGALAGTEYPCFTVQCEFELTGDDIHRLLVNVSVNRRCAAGLNVPMGNGHRCRMKELSLETGKRFFLIDLVDLNKRHGREFK